MKSNRSWASYPPDYRTRELATQAAGVQDGVSRAMVGPAGAGMSNLLGFPTHRPVAFQPYLPLGIATPAPIPVDLNDLRRKVEPELSTPRSILNCIGSPEGGYQCFPEGRPN